MGPKSAAQGKWRAQRIESNKDRDRHMQSKQTNKREITRTSKKEKEHVLISGSKRGERARTRAREDGVFECACVCVCVCERELYSCVCLCSRACVFVNFFFMHVCGFVCVCFVVCVCMLRGRVRMPGNERDYALHSVFTF